MRNEGQNLKPTLEWLRTQLAVMDGCCLDNPKDVERVAQHLFGNWVMVERNVTLELAAALEKVADGLDEEDSVWPSVMNALARYKELEVKP